MEIIVVSLLQSHKITEYSGWQKGSELNVKRSISLFRE